MREVHSYGVYLSFFIHTRSYYSEDLKTIGTVKTLFNGEHVG